MSKSKIDVLLLERVPSLGGAGDVVRVAPGYFRNCLCKRQAVFMTDKMKELQHRLLEERERQDRSIMDSLSKLLASLSGTTLVFKERADEYNHLYGSVSALDIAKAMSSEEFEVVPDMLSLDKPIKMLGDFSITVSFKGLSGEVSISVVPADTTT